MLSEVEQQLIEAHLGDDPVQVALRTGNRLVAQQVGVLAKARLKLPTFYEARCFILPISYQQSTSEVVASSRRFSRGRLALDLTCGLGADCYYLSRSFDRVITCEIDPHRAEIARYNFSKLGAENIEVRCCSAEELLDSLQRERVDMIFCDPARRDQGGGKRHALEDCSPNILEILPLMRRISRRISIKLSPLFDVDELFRLFGEQIMVEVVSLRNECKEVVLHLGDDLSLGHIAHTIIGGDGLPRRLMFDRSLPSDPSLLCAVEQCQWLYQADVALIKSRSTDRYMRDYYPDQRYLNCGFVLSPQELVGFVGSQHRISSIEDYKPKVLRKVLKSCGISSATIHLKGFPYPLEQIKKQLAVNEGAECNLFCFKDNQGNPKVAISRS
ncbi:MAG: methyltransferase domain-containing protein [Rikenellaceae bacterium]